MEDRARDPTSAASGGEAVMELAYEMHSKRRENSIESIIEERHKAGGEEVKME